MMVFQGLGVPMMRTYMKSAENLHETSVAYRSLPTSKIESLSSVHKHNAQRQKGPAPLSNNVLTMTRTPFK